jgi:5'-3' exonuclease
MAELPRVYLIDASIYVFRAWFTYPEDLSDRDGYQANAVYGYADFLNALLSRVKPAFIACAFDQSLSTSYRNEIYPAYKANREPAPKELKRQFEQCRQLTRSLGVAEYVSDRYEADDIIATLALMMRERGHPVTIVSADKDLTQLIKADHDEWWDYARNIRLDRDGIQDRFGVMPALIAEMLALAGDAVDNIPGIPGIGPKTAVGLLNRYGSLDAIFSNLIDVPDCGLRGAKRIQSLLENHEADARLALRLTRVCEEVPVNSSPHDLGWEGVDVELLETVIEQTGFNRNRYRHWL